MAQFKDPNTSKIFENSKFSTLSASVANTGELDGVTADFVSEEKIPFRLSRGDQSFYFQLDKVETGSIIRKNDGTVYVPYKKKNLQDMIIGPGSFVSKSFSSAAYLQVSSSYADLYKNIGDDVIMVQAVEEFYPIKKTVKRGNKTFNTFVGPVTASLQIFESGSTTASFSAIDNSDFGGTNSKGIPDFELDFSNSTYATHWTIRFDFPSDLGLDLSSSLFTPKIFQRFPGGNNFNNIAGTGSIILTSSAIVGPGTSGSEIGAGTNTSINGVNQNDGRYVLYNFRTRVAGDADSGSLYSFIAGKTEIITYGRGTEAFVNSASFQFSTTSRNAATGSSTIKTLYYYSGSGAGSIKTPPYDFFVTASGKGAPMHTDVNLRFTASAGFYSPSGSQYTSSIEVKRDPLVGLGPTYAFDYLA